MILKGVSLNKKEGEFVAIMGKSGSGKSTLLYNVSGMDNATSGEVIFDGQQLVNMSDEELSRVRLQKMGFIFQHSYLLKNLSIRDNIVLPGFKAGLHTRKQVNKEACELMEKTGIVNVAEHDITKVSGGQLQKVAAWADRIVFLVDGNIQSELNLNKFHENNINSDEREEELSKWLSKQGF